MIFMLFKTCVHKQSIFRKEIVFYKSRLLFDAILIVFREKRTLSGRKLALAKDAEL